jgi:hypothetical protein
MKLLKNGNWRYRNCTIQATPLGKYPTMVTIIKTPARLKELRNKKFITLEKTQLAIENAQAFSLIDGGLKSVSKQLTSLQMGNEMNG